MSANYSETNASSEASRSAGLRIVTAFFDTQDAADAARRDLIASGVPGDAIRLLTGSAAAAEGEPHPGFWESLKALFLPDNDRHVYAEGLRRGGIALSVEADDSSHDRAVEILDRDGAVDMEERSAGWRQDGWDAAALGEHEMAYAPAGGTTGGFAASRADQPLFDGPLDTAAIEPGQVASDEPAPTVPPPRVPGAPAASAPALERDLSHGRKRVWSYMGGGWDNLSR